MSELYEQLGLTRPEYEKIREIQGGEPSHVELAVYSLMWSEHCGYKHSRPFLKRFPTTGERVLQGPGENAGIVDIGGGLAVAMKIESHNHPSAVEPYQGAATGVGGILRDIFTMGARPICSLDSLRFGEPAPLPVECRPCPGLPAPEEAEVISPGVPGRVGDALGGQPPLPESAPATGTYGEFVAADRSSAAVVTGRDYARQRYLFEQVVAGIGGYGNCMGIPTVAGEVYFEDSYTGNCLVNAMTVGLVSHDAIIRSRAAGPGNQVVLIGAKTGRDGIGGASVLASQEFDEKLEEKRPSVQVGDPFTEKKLLEACLELLRAGRLVALQDLGAAGITSSSSEMAAKGGVGIDIHTDRVPLREADMEPWEIMISESQERMLAIVEPAQWPAVRETCSRWDLDSTIVGEVTDTGRLRVFHQGDLVGDMPAEALAEAPLYEVSGERPAHERDEPVELASFPRPKATPAEILLDLLGSPNVASRRWVWEQYDHQVQLNTVQLPGGDAAVLRVKHTGAGLALTTDGNGRHAYLDPYRGGKAAVAEAARNVSCTGAQPLAITNCLNFGNPEKGPISWQLRRAIEGMAEACEAFGTPVISGNVSLYNESFGKAIYPTPVVGMLGLLEDVSRHTRVAFGEAGDRVYLLGGGAPVLDGSEYQKRWWGRVEGRISDVDLEAEVSLQQLVRDLIKDGRLRSAHDCSDGGLAVAVAESCLAGGVGALLDLENVPGRVAGRHDLTLFGEGPTRIIVSLAAQAVPTVQDRCRQAAVPFFPLGTVGGDSLRLQLGGEQLEVALSVLVDAHEGGLLRALGYEA
jgi:phosphoribosylformylglycinamidine synthase